MRSKLKIISKFNISSFIFSLLVVIGYVCLLSKELFEFTQDYTIYAYVAVVVVNALVFFKIDYKLLILILINVFLAVVSVLFNGGGLGSAINYIIVIAFIAIISNIRYGKLELDICKFISLIAVILLVIYSFYYAYVTKNETIINPNTYAQIVAFSFMLTVSLLNFKLKSTKNIILYLISTLVVIVAIINFESRATLLSILAFTIFNLIPKKIISKKLLIIIVIASFAVQVLFPLLYVWLYNNVNEFEVLGKNFFSRGIVWSDILNKFGENPFYLIFGVGSKTLSNFNAHNLSWHMIMCFSPLVMVAFCVYIIHFVLKIDIKNPLKLKCFYAFVSIVLITGVFEVVIFYFLTLIYSTLLMGIASNNLPLKFLDECRWKENSSGALKNKHGIK